MKDPVSDGVGRERQRVGRPSIDAQPGGRQTIIAGMQRFMRLNALTSVQRMQIAEYAGVTPALVSYHFPNQLDLIICSASSVIVDYVGRINELLDRTSDLIEKFKSLTYEFIFFNFWSGFTLDYYIDAVTRRKKGEEVAALSRQYMRLLAFIGEVIETNADRVIDPAFLHSSLWSQCKYLGRQPHLKELVEPSEAESSIRSLSEQTFHLFARGCFR